MSSFRALDLRGRVPKTRQFYEFPIPEFPLNKHMDREALKQMITDLRAGGWIALYAGAAVVEINSAHSVMNERCCDVEIYSPNGFSLTRMSVPGSNKVLQVKPGNSLTL